MTPLYYVENDLVGPVFMLQGYNMMVQECTNMLHCFTSTIIIGDGVFEGRYVLITPSPLCVVSPLILLKFRLNFEGKYWK